MQNTQLVRVNEITINVPVSYEQEDQKLIDVWAREHAENTARYYKTDAQEFLSFVQKPIRDVTLPDIQKYEDSLMGLKQGSKARKINSVKSLLTFAYETGYTQFNVGKAHKAPKVRSELAQRILTEEQVIIMIGRTEKPRDHAMLRLMYHCGIRVSEVVSIKWRDLVARSEGGQVTVCGKGEKVRNILIAQDMWNELLRLRPLEYHEDDYVFQSRKGHGKLDESQVNRIVSEAAKRADIRGNVSPHWLRHSHASHSLDRGANINLVRDTLGHASLATTGKYTHARPNGWVWPAGNTKTPGRLFLCLLRLRGCVPVSALTQAR
jgi:integrase/recombinase XerD